MEWIIEPEFLFRPPPLPHSLLVKSRDVLASSSTTSPNFEDSTTTFLFFGGGKISSGDNPGLGLSFGKGGRDVWSLFIFFRLDNLYKTNIFLFASFTFVSGQVEQSLAWAFYLKHTLTCVAVRRANAVSLYLALWLLPRKAGQQKCKVYFWDHVCAPERSLKNERPKRPVYLLWIHLFKAHVELVRK